MKTQKTLAYGVMIRGSGRLVDFAWTKKEAVQAMRRWNRDPYNDGRAIVVKLVESDRENL